MSATPYVNFYPSDWLAGVASLTPAEVGVYINVLALIYEKNGPVQYDAKRLARRMGISAGPLKKIIVALIDQGKLIECNGSLTVPIVDKWRGWHRKDARRTAIPSEVREVVWQRDGEKCQHCGDTSGPFHLDHIYPWSRGGEHTPENLVVACAVCNLSKGARTPEEWMGCNG